MQGRRYTQRFGRWDDYIAGRQRNDPETYIGPEVAMDKEAVKKAFEEVQKQRGQAFQGVSPTPGAGQAIQGPGGILYDEAMKSALKAKLAEQRQDQNSIKSVGGLTSSVGQQLSSNASQRKAVEAERRRLAMAQLMAFANNGSTAGSIKVGI